MYRFTNAMLLASLLAAGACQPTPAGPDDASAPFENQLTVEERGYLIAKDVSPAALRTPHVRVSSVSVRSLDGDDVTGRSRLLRLHFGVLATVRTSGLEPGTATSLWMVVFNAPENCSDGECGADDLRDPAVRADLVWVDGAVVGRSGRARYRTFVREGDTTGSIAEPFLGLPGLGVEDTHAAEIHFVVRTHGPVLPGLAREMTSTFNGGCTLGSLPDDARLGQPGPNTCANLQAALHLP